MMRRVLVAILTFGVMPSISAQANAAQKMPTAPADIVRQILWWLPEDTETIAVTQGPGTLVGAAQTAKTGRAAASSQHFFLDVFPFLLDTREEQLARQFSGRTLLAAVHSGRKFRESKGFGMMPFEGCQVLVFRAGSGITQAALRKSLKPQRSQIQILAGYPIMSFREKREQDIWNLFFVVPKPDVVLCATNRAFLETVLKRMRFGARKRALPPHLPLWKYVNWNARYWALRHYSKAQARLDPTSPFASNNGEPFGPDKEAVGLVFDLDPRRSNKATLRYLTSPRNAPGMTRRIQKFWNGYIGEFPRGTKKPRIWNSSSGAATTEFVLDQPEKLFPFMFLLLGLFGHAISL